MNLQWSGQNPVRGGILMVDVEAIVYWVLMTGLLIGGIVMLFISYQRIKKAEREKAK